MLDPRTVFEDFPAQLPHFAAPDDSEVEDQYFDRKEAGPPPGNDSTPKRQLDSLREHIIACVSAFANTNQLGGLLVVGISKTGEIRGVNHLTDTQRNSISNLNVLLRNHAAQTRMIDCTGESGQITKLILIYVPYAPDAICETPGDRPKAWTRSGAQNVPLRDRQREQLRRDKRIVDFECSIACRYDPALLDPGLLKEIRQTWSSVAASSLSDADLLHQIGALEKTDDGYVFTKAGLLFFAANPQRTLPSAHVRLLRFDANLGDEERGTPTLDKAFTGSITKQLRDTRTFIRESALFKTYQTRRPAGGFAEEPEYPPIAVDEAVVNAVAHRDYAAEWPVECEYYKDAFVVRNPGKIIQRNSPVPQHFSLNEQQLIHTPRNPKLIDWLKTMRDNSGATFVRALSEGTRSMCDAMARLGLPSPEYDVAEAETTVTLLSESERRASAAAEAGSIPVTEHANLFPIRPRAHAGRDIAWHIGRDARREFLAVMKDAMRARGWFIDSFSHGLLTVHRRGVHHNFASNVDACVRLVPAYKLGIRDYRERSYLCIDPSLEVKNVLSLRQLLDCLPPTAVVGRPAIGKFAEWQRGKIVNVDEEWVTLHLFDYEREQKCASTDVIPDLPVHLIKKVLLSRQVHFDLRHSNKTAESASSRSGSNR